MARSGASTANLFSKLTQRLCHVTYRLYAFTNFMHIENMQQQKHTEE